MIRTVVQERKTSSAETEISREGIMQTFEKIRASAKENGLQNMSLDEINKEISLTRYGEDGK